VVEIPSFTSFAVMLVVKLDGTCKDVRRIEVEFDPTEIVPTPNDAKPGLVINVPMVEKTTVCKPVKTYAFNVTVATAVAATPPTK
jgi:hypothetical protein